MHLSGPPSHHRKINRHRANHSPSSRRGIVLHHMLDGDDDLDGTLGFSLKKLVKKVTQPVLTVQKKVHEAVTKIAPKQLRPILRKVSASTERMTESTLRPFEVPRLLKEEAAQIKGTIKQKEFQIGAALVAAAVATYFTGGAATGAIMALLKAAADRTAAKKSAAKSQAEADAAQAEFDAYAKSLAQQQAAQASTFTVQSPTGTVSLTPADSFTAAATNAPDGAGVRSQRMQTAGFGGSLGNLPSWVPIVALGLALAVPLATKGKRSK